MSRRKEMPPELMARFFQGVQEQPDTPNGVWESEIELRPARLGLGADPSKARHNPTTKSEKKIAKSLQKHNSGSDSESDSDSDTAKGRSQLGKVNHSTKKF